jgi:diguanylate cyclase (GGDEF)-like protein
MVGMSAQAKDQVNGLLQGRYELLDIAQASEAEALLKREGAVACCLVGDQLRERSLVARIASANRRVPVIVIGKDGSPEVAVEAIRQGAHDWLPSARLKEAGLERVVALAVERFRGASIELPLCSEVSTPGLFKDRLRQAKSRARRFSRRAALLLVGVDGFDRLNAALGYPAANRVLAHVAERLRASVRESDSVIHLGSEGFALVLEDLAEGSVIEVPAQRVLNSFATPFRSDDHEIILSANVGAVIYPGHGEDLEDLVRKAQAALSRARSDGRNRYRVSEEWPAKVEARQAGAAG